MGLEKDQEERILKNQGLVRYFVLKLGINPYSSDYDDMIQIGMIGLMKAAKTFDPLKRVTFATYASTCINNEIGMYYRKAKKYKNDIFLEQPIGSDEEGKEISLADKIEDVNSRFIEGIEQEDIFLRLLNIILNYLDQRERMLVLYRMSEVLQREIAIKLNISQSYMSRLERKCYAKIRKAFESQLDYKEFFSVKRINNGYQISFYSKEIKDFNRILAQLLRNLTSDEYLPGFKVSYNQERIVIWLPAAQISFSFLAQIIQEIDDFKLSKGTSKGKKRQDYVERVREYIQSRESFTTKEVVEHFPDIPRVTINNTIRSAVYKGSITSIRRGEFRVKHVTES